MLPLRPGVRAEVALGWQLCQQRNPPVSPINSFAQHVGAPPADRLGVVLHSEEYDDARKGDTAGQSCRQHVVVLLPPRRLVALEIVHEHEGDVQASREVGQVERRPVEEAVKDQRGMHVLEPRQRGEKERIDGLEDPSRKDGLASRADVRTEVLGSPPDKGQQKSEQEAVLHGRVNLAKDTLGTDGALKTVE